MKDSTPDPTPPTMAGLSWRPLRAEDLPALTDLARTCRQLDGGLTFMAEAGYLQERFFPGETGKSIAAFTPDERMAACSVVSIGGDPGKPLVKMTGLVQPELRGQGIGAYLLRWGLAQAHGLLAGAAESRVVLQISSEGLSEPAHRLFLAQGFHPVFEELVMQYDLRQPVPDRPLPPGVTVANWRPELAEQFFEAYQAAFRERPGFPGWSAAEWIGYVTENDHRPEWTLLASAGGAPAGFVVGNADLTTDPPGGYVWQIGVIPEQRRRGLASALLLATMRQMQESGAASVQLTVNSNNPGAIQAYSALGFQTTGRRARYERVSEE